MTTNTNGGLRSYGHTILRADDYDPITPYENGDFLLLADVAAWLMATYDWGRQERDIGRQEWTIDGLSVALNRMRPNAAMLDGFRRLLRMADEVVDGRLEELAR